MLEGCGFVPRSQADRWRAGGVLMESASPSAWRDLESAAALLAPNIAALAACRDAAAKAKKGATLQHRRAGAAAGAGGARGV